MTILYSLIFFNNYFILGGWNRRKCLYWDTKASRNDPHYHGNLYFILLILIIGESVFTYYLSQAVVALPALGIIKLVKVAKQRQRRKNNIPDKRVVQWAKEEKVRRQQMGLEVGDYINFLAGVKV